MDENGTPFQWVNKTEEEREKERKERKSYGAKCGHLKRRLLSQKRLTGKTLEFALRVVGHDCEVRRKLIAGEQLTDYELHLAVDVWLLRNRLGAR